MVGTYQFLSCYTPVANWRTGSVAHVPRESKTGPYTLAYIFAKIDRF